MRLTFKIILKDGKVQSTKTNLDVCFHTDIEWGGGTKAWGDLRRRRRKGGIWLRAEGGGSWPGREANALGLEVD